jgi:ketosteroid isomerase-like protein
MKHILVCFAALAFIVAGCGRPKDPAAVKAALEEMDKNFVKAFNEEDVEGIMASYWNSPNLVIMYPEADYMGYDAVKESWRKLFDAVDVKKFEVVKHNIEVGDHMAYDWGMWNYTFQPKGGPEMTISGRYLQVWAEKDGKWVAVADHASVPLPPSPPPAAPASAPKGKKK